MKTILKVCVTLTFLFQSSLQQQGCEPCEDYIVVEPVCGVNNVTYKNLCYAECNKVGVEYAGACSRRRLPCDCPNNNSPVWDLNGNQYMNECVANCYGKVAVSAKEQAFGV